MENRKTEFSHLPSEVVVNHVVPFLSGKTIHTAMQVSRGWLGLFNSPDAWMTRIATDYQIPIDILQNVAGYFKKVTDYSVDYIFLYNQLRHLRKIEYRLPNSIKFSYQDPSYYMQVLTCCLDSEAFALRMLAPIEDEMWITLSLYAGFNNVALLMRRHQIAPYLVIALKAGNLTFVKDVFSENIFEILDFTQILNAGVNSGNLSLVKWLMEKSDEEVELDVYTLRAAAASGNVQMLEYVMNFNFFANDHQGDEQTLAVALCSGSQEAVEWVSRNLNLKIIVEDIVYAAMSGNLSLVKYLVEGLKLIPTEAATLMAAQSGNLELFRYLLGKSDSEVMKDRKRYILELEVKQNDPIARNRALVFLWDLKKYIYNSALSGNTELVKYCQEELYVDLTEKSDVDPGLKNLNHYDRLIAEAIVSGNILLAEKLRQQHRVNSSYVLSLLNFMHPKFCVSGYFSVFAHTQQCFSAEKNSDRFLMDITTEELESVPYFIIALVDMLIYPSEFSLNFNRSKIIVENINYITTLRGLSIIENIQIRSQLKNACVALRESNYLNLASTLEELSDQLAKKCNFFIENSTANPSRKFYFE